MTTRKHNSASRLPRHRRSSYFLMAFSAAVILTGLCGFFMATAAFCWDQSMTPAQETALESARGLFMLGSGTILGLLGGGKADLTQQNAGHDR